MPEPFELTVTEATRRIRGGELSPTELAESVLDRIDSLDPELKAWVFVDRDAVLANAERRSAKLDRGAGLGVLHGVPMGVKDIFYTEGVPTTACSKLYAGFVPEYDATTVSLLKQAGAIVLGKTVTCEFAGADPAPTLNPWNPAHTPGGSSSGSAVAVAAGMCPAALGSQTVGSVLRPASYNGVVGFKPTFGRVSRYGVIPLSWSLDHVGWMTRSVEDAALLLQVLSKPDPHEPITLGQPSSDFMTGLESPTPPRIGLMRPFFYDHADPETQRHTDLVAERLSRAGAAVEEVSLPASIDAEIEDQEVIMEVEAAAFHQPMFPHRADEYQPMTRKMLERGLEVDALSYSRAMERHRRFTAEMHSVAGAADVLLTPSTPTPALADLTNTGDPLFQGPWTSSGLPAITIPSGLSASGLPLGIQLAAAPFAEAGLLAAASWCERVIDVHLTPMAPKLPLNRV